MKLTNQIFTLPALLLFATLSVLAFGAKSPTPEVLSTASAADFQGEQQSDVQLIDLTPRGFEPAEFTRAEGKFLLAVNNRSGVDGLSLQLTTRGRSVEARRLLKTKTWRKAVTLSPGEYLLSVEGHPEWLCRITIGSR
jgi:hypothetical protein